MNISSSLFLFLFLPLVILIYYIIPAKKTLLYRNIYLLIVSIFFYAYGEAFGVFLIIAMTLITWALGFMANGNRNTKKGKWAVALVVIMNVGVLFFYKYISSIMSLLGGIFSTKLPSLNYPLPLGLSFFCFSSISYIVDVYRGKVAVDKKFLNTALYLSIFFKITQGPISQYNQFEKSLKERKTTWDQFFNGIWLLIIGLAKKVILATGLSYTVTYAYGANYQTLPVTIAWLGAFSYMFQLYFDFSGYSDMAIGLGKMFGFEIQENFNYPYAATSVTEYWQRWHKTLGEWFRDYLYYPITLGPAIKIRKKLSAKHSKATCKFVVNLFTLSIIWLASSVWHGRSINYLIWGVINGGVSLIELYKKPMKNKKLDKIIGWSYTFFIALMVKTLTNIDTVGGAFSYYGAMFGLNGNPFSSSTFNFLFKNNWVIFVISAICAFPLGKMLFEKINASNNKKLILAARIIISIAIVIIFIISISFMHKTGYTTFLYQQF